MQILDIGNHKVNMTLVLSPLGDFVLPTTSDAMSKASVQCPIELHKMIKNSGTYNFLGLRIPVESQLNVEVWRIRLQHYWDTQLLDLIRFGFPLDFNRQSILRWEDKNHTSALQFPQDVDAYLEEEVKFKAIKGPFQNCPIPNCHFSPFLTRENSNAAHRRVIIDLSWPKDASVNLGIDKNSYLNTDFSLTFPNVDVITNALKNVGTGAYLYKVGLSRVFRHVKIDPHDFDLLGLKWRDATFFDTCLPFKSRHGMQIFQRLSDAVHFVMHDVGYNVINYVDDFVGVGTPDVAQRSFDYLRSLLQELGLDVSDKKLIAPCTKVVCLGVEIDAFAKTISIPCEKMECIQEMVQDWCLKKICSRQQLQSLLGYLLYIHKCVKPARVFVNRMLELLGANYDKKTITLSHDFKRDLRWFVRFLESYNRVSYFEHGRMDGTIELDVCLTGFGGSWENFIYHVPIERKYKNLAITQLEMLKY